jgi:uncharacterized protein YxjI
MEIKVQCECGTKFKFDVEPVHGRMPVPVACPECATDATASANQFISKNMAAPISPANYPAAAVGVSAPRAAVAVAAPAAPVAVAGGGLRIARAEVPADVSLETEPAESETTSYQSHSRGRAPRSLLERTTFFIKERVAVLKLTDTYDILDPANGQVIGVAKEEPPTWAKFLRLAVKKHMLPTAINIYEAEGAPPVASVQRGFTFLRSKVQVVAGGRSLGYFKSKLISIGGGFNVFDSKDQQVAEVKGDWKGWNFRFLNKGGREIGTVTKKWAGLGKELFTSADNYIISLNDLSGTSPDASTLLLAAGLAIDVVYKERD